MSAQEDRIRAIADEHNVPGLKSFVELVLGLDLELDQVEVLAVWAGRYWDEAFFEGRVMERCD